MAVFMKYCLRHTASSVELHFFFAFILPLVFLINAGFYSPCCFALVFETAPPPPMQQKITTYDRSQPKHLEKVYGLADNSIGNTNDKLLMQSLRNNVAIREKQRNDFHSIAPLVPLLIEMDVSSPSSSSSLELEVTGKLKQLRMETDEVVRILDANTVKLKKNGLVSFAAVQTPSGYKGSEKESFSECLTISPSKKIRQLLPPKTAVRVRFMEKSASGSSPRRALVARANDGLFINTELVRVGFAKFVQRNREEVEALLPGSTELLTALQRDAKQNGKGVYQTCTPPTNDGTAQTGGTEDAAMVLPPDDQFEPMERTVETRWGDDGGKRVLIRQREAAASAVEPPPNPGDRKGCSDFETYEDALRWYEAYFPFYGDVARLDRDNDGVPCPGLPHTKNQNLYRMKVPSSKPRQ